MAVPQTIHLLLKNNGGMVTTAQANGAGVSSERLRLLVEAGDLERATTGVYILPGDFADMMFITQLRRPKVIYSHETALFLHGLTDRDPISYMVTVPTGYNPARLREMGLKVFTIKNDLHKVGVTQLGTIFGNSVTVYDLERTICDCLRSRNSLDIAVVTDAIKRYAKHKDKNLNALMQMATTFRVNKLLTRYMEVLL